MDGDRLASQIKELREHASRVEEELRQFGVQLLQQPVSALGEDWNVQQGQS